jgi:hypothetical protein
MGEGVVSISTRHRHSTPAHTFFKKSEQIFFNSGTSPPMQAFIASRNTSWFSFATRYLSESVSDIVREGAELLRCWCIEVLRYCHRGTEVLRVLSGERSVVLLCCSLARVQT